MVDELSHSADQLPDAGTEAHQRGSYQRIHYALWADYNSDIRLSKEYVRDLPASQVFLQANQHLFERLSNELRLLTPETYQRYGHVDQYLTGDLRRLGGAWHGMALNRQIGVDNKVHQDWQDDVKGFNAVVPWGDTRVVFAFMSKGNFLLRLTDGS